MVFKFGVAVARPDLQVTVGISQAFVVKIGRGEVLVHYLIEIYRARYHAIENLCRDDTIGIGEGPTVVSGAITNVPRRGLGSRLVGMLAQGSGVVEKLLEVLKDELPRRFGDSLGHLLR